MNVFLIIALSIILIILIGASVFALVIFNALAQALVEDNEFQPEEIFPCTLFLNYNFNQPEEKIITDFSRYEDFGIISMSAFSVDKPRSPEEEKVNGSVLIIKDVEVYSAEESFYGWRFRDQ